MVAKISTTDKTEKNPLICIMNSNILFPTQQLKLLHAAPSPEILFGAHVGTGCKMDTVSMIEKKTGNSSRGAELTGHEICGCN